MQYVLMVCIFGKTSRRERRGRAGGGRERLWSPPAEPQTGFYFSFKSWRRIEDARNSHVSRAGLLLLSTLVAVIRWSPPAGNSKCFR